MLTNTIDPPRFYDPSPGDSARVYAALCAALGGREAAWEAFEAPDWDLLAYMAAPEREGVGALLFDHFRKAGRPPQMPADVWARLEGDYYNNLGYNLLLFEELGRFAAALAGAGIPVVMLKGAALAPALYGDLGLRPMGDLDVLVPPPQIQAAAAAARALGFGRSVPARSPLLERWLSHHVHLRKLEAGREIAVEIHHTLVGTTAYRYGVAADWFWERTEPYAGPAGFPEGAHLRLDPTAELLFLSAHSFLQHGGGIARLLWRVDLDRLIRGRGAEIDFEALFAQAARFRWTPALAAALRSIERTLGTPLPPAVGRFLAATADRELEPLVESKIRGPRSRTELADHGLQSMRPPARLLMMLAILFPHPDYLRRRYDPRLAWTWPLYYPYRWFDLLRDGLRSVVRPDGGN